MDAKGIAFLRGIGVPEECLDILAKRDVRVLVDGESMAGWLRDAYSAGRTKSRDVYAWYSVEELMERPLA